MRKRSNCHFAIFISVVVILAIICIFAISRIDTKDNTRKDATIVEYKIDKQPIIDRFPSLPEFKDCYWKADNIGKTDFGPSNYWMRGFVVLEPSSFDQLKWNHTWVQKDIIFPNGIDPTITKAKDFNWCNSSDFTSDFLGGSFVGDIYFDTTNGILYFDVEPL